MIFIYIYIKRAGRRKLHAWSERAAAFTLIRDMWKELHRRVNKELRLSVFESDTKTFYSGAEEKIKITSLTVCLPR